MYKQWEGCGPIGRSDLSFKNITNYTVCTSNGKVVDPFEDLTSLSNITITMMRLQTVGSCISDCKAGVFGMKASISLSIYIA